MPNVRMIRGKDLPKEPMFIVTNGYVNYVYDTEYCGSGGDLMQFATAGNISRLIEPGSEFIYEISVRDDAVVYMHESDSCVYYCTDIVRVLDGMYLYSIDTMRYLNHLNEFKLAHPAQLAFAIRLLIMPANLMGVDSDVTSEMLDYILSNTSDLTIETMRTLPDLCYAAIHNGKCKELRVLMNHGITPLYCEGSAKPFSMRIYNEISPGILDVLNDFGFSVEPVIPSDGGEMYSEIVRVKSAT